MRNPKEKIFVSFTYEELAKIRDCLKEIQGLTEFEKGLISKINKSIDEGEKWF